MNNQILWQLLILNSFDFVFLIQGVAIVIVFFVSAIFHEVCCIVLVLYNTSSFLQC